MKPCIAGELIELIKNSHTSSEHFDLKQVNKGHYFYQLKENLAS